MRQIYSWGWVEARVAEAIEDWRKGAVLAVPAAQRYSAAEQQTREQAYDAGLQAVEREVRRAPRSKAERLATQDRIIASFAKFSATALDLQGETVELLTSEFLPVGTKLARWARQFDANLTMAEITQACRNAWTACGLQPLLGERVGLTPSILGYSLLYPYSDNYLDREDVSAEAKLRFSLRFRQQLRGEKLVALDARERALAALIKLIEDQYPRESCEDVFDCLLAIHRAQEESIEQLRSPGDTEVLRMSCAKGGSSVLADACLARGRMNEAESRFAFAWGILLQLGDDLQDVREDLRRGSVTLFSSAAAAGVPLDALAVQLLHFGEHVGAQMDRLPHGSRMFKDLLKMSWRSLIIRAVADSQQFFSPGFLVEAERFSPFRFEFLRSRQGRLASRQGLYAMLFDAFLETRGEEEHGPLYMPAALPLGAMS